MIMKAAFIMKARTRYNDFTMGRFLVSPDDFTEEETERVSDYVAAQNKYLDAAPAEGIRVRYCDEKFVVLGRSIFIANLYKRFGRETQYSELESSDRRNHAFLGFVFHRDEVHEIFDVTYEHLLEFYESYMSEL